MCRYVLSPDSLPCISLIVLAIQKASLQTVSDILRPTSCRMRNITLVALLTLVGCYAVAHLFANVYIVHYHFGRSMFSKNGTEEGIVGKGFTMATLQQVQRAVSAPNADGRIKKVETVNSALSAFNGVARISVVPGASGSTGGRTNLSPAAVLQKAFLASGGLQTPTSLKSGHIARVKRRTRRTNKRTGSVSQQTQSHSRRRCGCGDFCDRYWRSEECYRQVIEFAQTYQQNNTVVIVVTTGGSYSVIINWCISMQRLDLSNYFLVALDDDAQHFFQQRNAPVVQLPKLRRGYKVSRSDVWIERILVVYMILKAGINVLVTDADAVMMKSPFGSVASLFHDDTMDIISSPSNFPNPRKGELPGECAAAAATGGIEWRHQPCMGWTFFRSRRRVITFFDELFLQDVLLYRDDQIGFNCAIRRAGTVWREERRWTMWKAMVSTSKRPRMWLAMLPAAIYVRNCTESEDGRRKGYGISGFDSKKVEMYHCKGSSKRKNAENNGFWFLRRDWARHMYGGNVSFTKLLRSVST